MADKTLGLGKLMAKSKSIRRRRGSVDFNESRTSFGSDDAHDHSSLSRFAHHFTSHNHHHHSHAHPDAPTEITTDSDQKQPVAIHMKDDSEDTSLVSYDSEPDFDA